MSEIASLSNLHPVAASRGAAVYLGPERRGSSRDTAALLTRMLDEIDYGILIVNADAEIVYLNYAARLEMDSLHPLQMQRGRLGAHRPQDVAPLFDAMAAAQRGLRRMLTVGHAEHRIAVSVVPLPDPAPAPGASGLLTQLTLGKREVCSKLSVQGFARCHHLTPAETRVLEQLCGGVKPSQIADGGEVAVSTVRTQIGSIRAKTGAASIRELVRQVAVLPPMVGALRCGTPLHG